MSLRCKTLLVLVLFFGIFIFLTLNKNSKSESGIGNYQSEFWADKGGYYIYLPWLFIHNCNADNFPDEIEQDLGYGMEIRDGKMKSKYMIGVALLQTPFFILGHLNALLIYDEPTGFEKVYANWMGVGSVFYLLLGMFFSYLLIAKFTNQPISIIAVFAVLLGSNLYYYGIDETMMSHVYSFFLISVLNYFIIGEKNMIIKNNFSILLLVITFIFLIRPINIIYVLLLFMFFYKKHITYRELLKQNNFWFFGIFSLLMLLLQIVFWNYAYSSFTPRGYEGESFTNFLSPKILQVLFAPNNGWFIYAPLLFFIIIISIFQIHKFERNISAFTILISIIYIYIISSWWLPDFGCGMGCRNIVDFSGLFMLQLGIIIKKLKVKSIFVKTFFALILISLCSYTIIVTYNYDNCYFGETDWDWDFLKSKIHV